MLVRWTKVLRETFLSRYYEISQFRGTKTNNLYLNKYFLYSPDDLLRNTLKSIYLHVTFFSNASYRFELSSSIKLVLLVQRKYWQHGKVLKSHIRIINLRYKLQLRMKNLNYLMDHILFQILKIIPNIYLKSMAKNS